MSCEDVLAFEDRRADRALESELFLGRGDCAREEGEGKDSWSSIPRAGLCSPVLSKQYLIPPTQSPAFCY